MYVGRNYERADLRGKDLRAVDFTCSNFRAADLSGADLRGAVFKNADLSRACLHNVRAQGANFELADLSGAYLKGADFTGANMWHCYLRRVSAKDAVFAEAVLTGADVSLSDFLGARFDGAKADQLLNLDTAMFFWFLPPGGGRPLYRPYPGAMVLTQSQLGKVSYQENTGLGKSGLSYREALDPDASATGGTPGAGKEAVEA